MQVEVKQHYGLLSQLCDLVDGAAQGEGAEAFMAALQRQVSLLKAQEWDGFDFNTPCPARYFHGHGQGRTALEALWAVATKLWNMCISARNNHALGLAARQGDDGNGRLEPNEGQQQQQQDSSGGSSSRNLAWIRDSAVELTALVPEVQLSSAHLLQKIRFCKQAGEAWMQLGEVNQAELLLSHGERSLDMLLEFLSGISPNEDIDWEEQLIMAFDLQVLHLQSFWLLGQEEAATQMRAQCCAAALGTAPGWQLLTHRPRARFLSMNLSGMLSWELLQRADDLLLQAGSPQSSMVSSNFQPEDAALQSCIVGVAGGAVKDVYDILTACHQLIEASLSTGLELQASAPQDKDMASDGSNVQGIQAQLLQRRQECLLKMMLVHVSAREGGRALQCFEAAARDSSDVPGSIITSPSCLALKALALAMIQKVKEAEEELVCLMAHPDALDALCMDVVSELLAQGASLSALGAAVHILQDKRLSLGKAGPERLAEGKGLEGNRDPGGERPGFLLQFATMAALDQRLQEVDPEAVDQLLLDVLGPASQLAASTASLSPSLKAACHLLLWNQAVSHFTAKRHDKVLKLLEAAVLYCSPGEQALKTWRTMSLSCLALKQFDSALQMLDSAVHQQGEGEGGAAAVGSVADAFIRLKVHLSLGAEASALEQVHSACRCPDFDPAVLEVMCQEAHRSGAFSVAKGALVKLHAALAHGQAPGRESSDALGKSTGPYTGLSEGTVLRTLIRFALEEAAEKQGSAAEDASDGAPSPSCHTELAKYFNLASNRLETVGHDAFFGEDDRSKSSADLEWMANMAWNAAQRAGDAGDYESCVVMLAAHSSLLGMHPTLGPTCSLVRRRAYMLAASSAILVHSFNPAHRASLALATSMISSARRVRSQAAGAAAAAAAAAAGAGDQEDMDELEAYLVFQELEIAVRGKDAAATERMLSGAVPQASALLPPDYILPLVELCRGGAYKNLAACQQCLSLALDQAMRQADAGFDATLVARLVRERVLLATRDEERLQRYEEALGIVAGVATRRMAALAAAQAQGGALPSAHGQVIEYPEPELRWLISNCWNRGCHHRRISRLAEAVPYMRLALRLLEYCPGMAQEFESMMTEEVRGTEAALDTVGSPAA